MYQGQCYVYLTIKVDQMTPARDVRDRMDVGDLVDRG